MDLHSWALTSPLYFHGEKHEANYITPYHVDIDCFVDHLSLENVLYITQVSVSGEN